MSDTSFGYLNDPGIWWDADVRRRQISQLLHVITPAVAMCVVLTAGPGAMFASTAAWSTWPWNLLLAMGVGVLVWDVRALWLRRRVRRTPLTVPVDSIGQAFRFAEDALGLSAWPPSPGDYVGRRAAAPIDRGNTTVWESYAVLPLAALAYTASQTQDGNAMEWLTRTVTRLCSADADEAWGEAAHAVAATTTPTVHSSFFRTVNMEHRQRDSVALVMRDAVLGANVAVQR